MVLNTPDENELADSKIFEYIKHCPECGSTLLIKDEQRGETVCGTCGLVIDQKIIDQGAEWNAYTAEERNRRARTGSPTSYTIHDKGLSTLIDWQNKDIFGNEITGKRKMRLYRLRKLQYRSQIHSSSSRNLSIAMSELDRLSSQLHIPKPVKQTAAVIYRRAIEREIIKGYSIEGMISAALYAACRLRKLPRTLEEVSEYTRTGIKKLGKNYRMLVMSLGIRMPISSPDDYIAKFGEKLNLSGRVQRLSAEMLEEARNKGLTTGKDPKGLAAAAIYITGIQEGERRTQKELAEIAGVTEVTVRNRYKNLVKELNLHVAV